MQVLCDEMKFQWRIENFSIIRHNKKLLEGQEFSIELGAPVGVPCKWTFSITSETETVITPAGAEPGTGNNNPTTTTVEWLEIVRKLVEVPADGMEICNSCSLKIKDKNRKSFFKGYGSVNSLRLNGYRTFKKVLRMSDKSDQLPLIDNALVIDFTVRTYNNRHTSTVNESSSRDFKEKSTTSVTTDLVALLKRGGGNGENEGSYARSDVKIISKDGQEFHAHKLILGSRNSVFGAMFDSNLTEGQTGIIQLEDLSGKALALILEYIYGGILSEPEWYQPEVIVELTYAAGKYQLTDLLEHLDEVLGVRGKGEHAGALLALCENLGLEKAEKELMHYVKTHAVPCAANYADLVNKVGNNYGLS